MTQIPFSRQSPTTDTYTHGDYTFKRRHLNGSERYEVWKSGVLLANNLSYWDVLAVYQEIMSGDGVSRFGWMR